MTESEQAIADFLAQGGVIQQIPIGKSGRVEGSSYSAWGAPRKAGRPAADAVATIDPEDSDLDE
jgi:hypothetical protein